MGKNVKRCKNVISIYKMNHPACVSSFLLNLKEGIAAGYDDFQICWLGDQVYPNACVPIAGIIQHFKKQKIEFDIQLDDKSYLKNSSFIEPIYEKKEKLESERSPFDKIYRYDDYSQVAALTQAYVDAISKQAECSEGILESLIWCINEVMDNVLIHGMTQDGYVMAQFHPRTEHIVFCIYDDGVGIYNSLKTSEHGPKNPLDAISLAIQEGVGDGLRQGNGLFGLHNIIVNNQGSFTITSGSASLMYLSNSQTRTFNKIPFLSYEKNSTIVDFQLDLNKDVNIQNTFQTIGGFDGFDIRIDNMIQENDMILYDVYNNCSGTATRAAGKELRYDVINTLKRLKNIMILDFTNVNTVSSSFIDEFIAKLILQVGLTNFMNSFRIRGMNDTVKFLCDRSTYMRIHREWENLSLNKLTK